CRYRDRENWRTRSRQKRGSATSCLPVRARFQVSLPSLGALAWNPIRHRCRALADTLRGESESLASASDEISIEANQEITRIQRALMHESDPAMRETMLEQLFAAEQLLAPEPKV